MTECLPDEGVGSKGEGKKGSWTGITSWTRNIAVRLMPCREGKWKKQRITHIEDPEDRFSEKELSCLAKGRLNLLDLESVYAALPMIGRSNLQTRTYGSDESYQVVVHISHPFSPAESKEEVRKSMRQRILEGFRWIRKRFQCMRSRKLEV